MAILEDSRPFDPYDPEDPFGCDPMDSGVMNWVVHKIQDDAVAAENLQAAGLTVMGFKAAGEDPVMQISEESARRARILGRSEHVCAKCGCSDSRACHGGCVWATTALCSKCALKGYAGGAAGG